MRRFAPVFVLLVFAPLSAEVLLGDVPLSLLFTFPILMGFYGTASLLIREFARRRGPGWSRIVLLGIAFGIVAEGLVFQSLFNPHFPGAGSFAVYGRLLGINWYWLEYVVGWHTVWSISLPILFTELLFPARRSEPWLGRVGLWIAGIIFVLISALEMVIYYSLSGGFSAAPWFLAGAVLLAAALIALALFLPARTPATDSQRVSRNAPSLWLIGFFALVVGIVWLGIHEIISPEFVIPAPILILLLALLAVAVVLVIRRWSAAGHHWEDRQRLALASGALLAGLLVGLKIVQDGNLIDLLAQAVFCVIITVLLAVFNWRLHAQNVRTGEIA